MSMHPTNIVNLANRKVERQTIDDELELVKFADISPVLYGTLVDALSLLIIKSYSSSYYR
jgi:hypothetical protein